MPNCFVIVSCIIYCHLTRQSTAFCTVLANEAESLRRIYFKTFNFTSIMLQQFCISSWGMLTTWEALNVIKFLPGRNTEVIKRRCFKVWLCWVLLWNWKWVLRALLGVWSRWFCISIMGPFCPALIWDSCWDIEEPLRGTVRNDLRKHLLIISSCFPLQFFCLLFSTES